MRWKFWTASQPTSAEDRTVMAGKAGSPLVVLLRDRSGKHLREEVHRAGLDAFSYVMVRRARLMALTAHSTAGGEDVQSHLAITAGFLALAGGGSPLVSAGWCYRVLHETALPRHIVRQEVSGETLDLVKKVISPEHIGAAVRPGEQALGLSIMATHLLEALLTGRDVPEVATYTTELKRTITPLSAPGRHLVALNIAMANYLTGVPEWSLEESLEEL